MISRTSTLAAVFALLAAASLASAAELHVHRIDSSSTAARAMTSVQLPMVVVTGKRDSKA